MGGFRAAGLQARFALVLFKRKGGRSSKVANTVGGFEVQQILNESKVFSSRTSYNKQLSISIWL